MTKEQASYLQALVDDRVTAEEVSLRAQANLREAVAKLGAFVASLSDATVPVPTVERPRRTRKKKVAGQAPLHMQSESERLGINEGSNE